MEHPAYIAFAIPLFLFFMLLEYLYVKRKGKNFFQFAESVANINVGIAERLTDVFTMIPFFYFFQYIHDHFALFDIPSNAITWVLLFLCTDLIWYWYHRFAHEVNLFWAAHIVHHQSEDFNYTTSARITVFQAVIRCGFWAILPLLGFPVMMVTSLLLIHGLYPFFIHTQAIGKLGWFEYFLVTPSHHRVHHASNPEYLDKNYGDILIIWDKIFGTFVKEKEQPIYGLTHPIKSHSFLWQHFHYPLEMYISFKRAKGFKAKWLVLWGKPELMDPSVRVFLERFLLKRKPRMNPTILHRNYIIGQTLISVVLLFVLVYKYEHISTLQVLMISIFILLSLINTGAILEQKSWIFYLEYLRFILILAWVLLFIPHIFTLVIGSIMLIIILYHFRSIEKGYKKLLYQAV